MGTTAEKLQAILDSKADIKDAIEANGVTVGDAPFSEYANKILEITAPKQVEYLESSGTQFITIPYAPKDTPRAVIEVAFIKVEDKDIFGFANNIVPSWIGNISLRSDGKIQAYYRYYTTASSVIYSESTYSIGEFITIDAGNELKVNNETIKSFNVESFSSNSQYIRLFSSRYPSTIRIKSCKLYDGNALVADLIPVRIPYSNSGGMYDKVSNRYFDNVGEGEFISGPVV